MNRKRITDCPTCGGDCQNGHIESDLEYAHRVANSERLDDDPRLSKALRESREPSIDGEIIVGYALDEGEDYSFLDPEPITGHTLLEEIRFSLYATQAELKRLERLLDTYEDVSRLRE